MAALCFRASWSSLQKSKLLRNISVCTRRTLVVSASAAETGADSRRRVVFLGSPNFAAESLRKLRAAEEKLDIDVALVVTQPPQPAGRKRHLTPTPVHIVADELEIQVVAPMKASDPNFLEILKEKKPDLCITAAYGNFLPTKFLNVPKYGTLNIHPSLLPAFRGAAPVPRALEAGVDKTGVTVMFTVLEMDAGPIASQVEIELTGDEKAPDLLHHLFDIGIDEVIRIMPKVFAGEIQPQEQDGSKATHAAKMSKEEGTTAFTENAVRVHNKVRAFADWPGVWAEFISESPSGKREELRVKLLTTKVHKADGGPALGVHEIDIKAGDDAIRIVCDDGSVLDVLELQPQGRKPMTAKAFKVGLQNKTFSRKRIPH
eukprot:Plantae.Rhodophyta-Purpureofilum_apyrenoidigerum.ctg1944.p1 GENE.Plantae.Rhodophyta-Purpureofilum_apyrenoidigerum.ctg1944~~Plantae.Rhodophyta-Purpureofilum_apyrenoidigerum.ctg1944.p1  ORF type:complete len:374 (-),score=78.73 Plantae.Rhodophyta-Purpureofilum_apyrenoidigerum.ctg1944:1576-2697(-)